jgi:hypothetical protein
MDKTCYTMTLRHWYNKIRAQICNDHDLSRSEAHSVIEQLYAIDEELWRIS